MPRSSLPAKLVESRIHADALIAQSHALAEYSRAYLHDQEHWSPNEDALLGTDTDRAIAEKLGRSSVAVTNRRKKLGIMRRASA